MEVEVTMWSENGNRKEEISAIVNNIQLFVQIQQFASNTYPTLQSQHDIYILWLANISLIRNNKTKQKFLQKKMLLEIITLEIIS